MSADVRAREAVAVFEDVGDLDEAVRALLAAGFAYDDLSLLADRRTVERKLGHAYEKVEELEDDPKAPRIAYRRPIDPAAAEGNYIGAINWAPPLLAAGAVVASTGLITGLVVGAAVAGGLAANVLGHVIDQRHAHWLQEQLDHGGVLLWVRLKDDEAAELAVHILTRHAVHDVHIHEVDPDATPRGSA
jgi:hypothetical protein